MTTAHNLLSTILIRSNILSGSKRPSRLTRHALVVVDAAQLKISSKLSLSSTDVFLTGVMQRPRSFNPPWIDFFIRPCPWFVKQLTTFPQFPRLPKELQLMIWKVVVPERRVIQLTNPDAVQASLPPNPPEGAYVMYVRFQAPAILYACYDSRVEGLKKYTKAFASYTKRPIYFDFDRDYLELDVRTLEYFAELSEDYNLPLVEPPRIKNLAVINHRALRAEDLVFYCQFFSSLERLLVTEPEVHRSISSPGLPYTFLPDQKSFRHNWDTLRAPIMKKIPFVRPPLEKWAPPSLVLGTDTQWIRHKRGDMYTEPTEIWGGYNPNVMDWEPTTMIPSLEYVPRLEAVGNQRHTMGFSRESLVTITEDVEEKEHQKVKSLVFYQTLPPVHPMVG